MHGDLVSKGRAAHLASLALLAGWVLGVAGMGGCDPERPATGREGGPCYLDGTCNEGLLCFEDLCVTSIVCYPLHFQFCDCGFGQEGERPCLPDGTWGECDCSCVPGELGWCPSEIDDDCTRPCLADGTWGACACPCPPALSRSCACEEGSGVESCGPGGTWQGCRCEGCGNDLLDPGEACDASLLGGVTCQDLGYPGGTLGCSRLCTFDLTACEPLGQCGDGDVARGDLEWCDGGASIFTSCAELGFIDGNLACAENCTFDLSGCRIPADRCGDGVLDAGEVCDDGSRLDGDGCSSDCLSDETCGNGRRDPVTGETCDLNDLGGVTCADLGFLGGLLTCDLTCRHDVSGCSHDQILIEGVVFGPGADLASTLEVNRFPLPGVTVTAHTSPPPALPLGITCPRCEASPPGVPTTVSDPVDGRFGLLVSPSQTYYLTLQAGGFRRVTALTTPAIGNLSFGWQAGGPRPRETTLPALDDPVAGDRLPSIAVVDAAYENLSLVWNAVGLSPGVAIHEVPAAIVTSPSQLAAYQMLIVPSGEDWPGGSGAALRDWVAAGGVLWVHDFNYDFVEVPWPDFLSWYTGSAECGTPAMPTDGAGLCNRWDDGPYGFSASAVDPNLAAWLALPEVSQGASLEILAAWDTLHSLSFGVVGVDPACGTGPGGEVSQVPRVLVRNEDGGPFQAGPLPAMVAFPFYCGRVIYTVFGSHSGYPQPYPLLLQEKLLLRLMIQLQGCRLGLCQ